jgi:putative inorganic carbon (HCO3(-)) transporter
VSFLNPRGFTPNIVAGALGPLVPLAAAWGLAQTRARRWLLFALAVFLAFVLLLTQSRGALLALVGVTAMIPVMYNPRRFLAPTLAVGAGLVIVFVLFQSTAIELMLASDSQGSASERLELWDRALRMLRDFSFTGIGIGTFEPTVMTLYPLFVANPGAPQPHAHNLFLQMGVDFGVGGFVAFVGLTTLVLITGWMTIRRAKDSAAKWVAVGLLAGMLVFFLHGFLDAIFVSTKVSVVIWSLVGLMMTVNHLQRSAE